MKNKNKSIFKRLIDTVFTLPHWASSHAPDVKKAQQESPFNQTESSHSSQSLSDMEWQEFEQLIHAIFRQRGYSVSEKQAGAFDGVDLVLKRDNETTYVQCKPSREEEVDITAVGELYVAMEVDAVKFGIVITPGVFSPEAIDFSLGKSLMLINGNDLAQMIDALNSSNSGVEQQTDDALATAKQEMPELEPLCPICSSAMIKRTAKKGRNAGNVFWGCSNFPKCRGVVS